MMVTLKVIVMQTRSKAQEYEIKYLCTKCTVLHSTRIQNQISLYKMHSITKYKNMKSNIFVQNAQYYKAQEYEIKYLYTKCTVLQSTRIRNQIYLYKMNKCQFLQESSRNPSGMPGIPG